ncbi:unnamed protein product [Nyctereutes procyonoides]|uniref:(raccoon dog) hypothetical protein n=1 Tax=Nyctereutes procyonoides TaxID=34880 RepID=A0A811Y660_NYCPR|nr:unnamed protein product [Nyctereutes procyonoides]
MQSSGNTWYTPEERRLCSTLQPALETREEVRPRVPRQGAPAASRPPPAAAAALAGCRAEAEVGREKQDQK